MMRSPPLFLILLACATPVAGQAPTPPSPDEGGPRNWEVTGVETVLNLRASPSSSAEVLHRLEPGTILDNLDGCRAGEGRVWCDVQPLGGGPRGWAAVSYLTPAVAPDGVAHTGPDDSALRAGRGDFDATGTLPCAWEAGQPMTECDFGVARAGGGYATVVVEHPGGHSRAIYFRMARNVGADVSEADRGGLYLRMRRGDRSIVWIGPERYEIHDAVVLGG